MHKWLSVSAVVIAIDVYTKHLIQLAFHYGERVQITSYFDLVRFHNEGAAFSFLANQGGWQHLFFTVIAVVASAVMVYLLRTNTKQKLFCFAIALVLGGALGNLYDRLTLGYVVDFLFFITMNIIGLLSMWPIQRLQAELLCSCLIVLKSHETSAWSLPCLIGKNA